MLPTIVPQTSIRAFSISMKGTIRGKKYDYTINLEVD